MSPAFAGTPAGTACSSTTPAPVVAGAPNNGTSTTNGGACDVSGSVTVASSLAMTVGVSSFHLTSGNVNTSPTYQVCVVDNNAGSTGYYVDGQVTSAFTGSVDPTKKLTVSDFMADTVLSYNGGNGGNETQHNVTLTPNSPDTGLSTVVTMLTVPGLSTGHNYSGPLGVGTGVDDCPSINGNAADTFGIEGWNLATGAVNLIGGNTAPAQDYNGVFTEALWG
jgi:hypothetical protein